MTTPLDALVTALRAAGAYNAAAEAPPEAIVWCDPGHEFVPLLPALRDRLPGLLTFGAYDPATRTGPALWLRAAAVRAVPDVTWPEDEPPIVYLPGLGREALRGAEDCPQELAPLVWFAVAGTFFGQPKQARDWTLRGFLSAQGSPVGLDIADDKTARGALARAATRLFAEPVESLSGRRWDATALDSLLVEDPAAGMLAWMDGRFTAESDPERFEAFAVLASRQFGFDPRKKKPADAANRLARREKNWAKVWERFAQHTSGYEGVVTLLEGETPANLLDSAETYPAENTRLEAELRKALLALDGRPRADAVTELRKLEKKHGWRRTTVWAKRGNAKLAQALEQLLMVAEAPTLPAHDAGALAEAYAEVGWRADDAVLRALDLVRTGADRQAVVTGLRAVYLPWLDANAEALQALAEAERVPFARPQSGVKPEARSALLFVDGLRFDVGQRVAEALRARGAKVDLTWGWSGFPTITSTCKALASPAADRLEAGNVDELIAAYGGKDARKPTLVKAIEDAGWVTAPTLLGDDACWREVGRLDEDGHHLGARLAEGIADAVAEISETVFELARSGRRVRIVTDHGWLLLPDGLPKADLAASVVEPSKKANRVALLKEGAPSDFIRLPWSWDATVMPATPPGARAFYRATEYAHGGVSPQECVLPVLDVTFEGAEVRPSIAVTWRQLMAKVRVEGGAGLTVDVRVGTDVDGPTALIKGPKILDDAGEASVGIDDAHEGRELCVVVYRSDAPDEVLARRPTKAGE